MNPSLIRSRFARPFWKADAHLRADAYFPQKGGRTCAPWLSQKLYLSGQRSKTRLSIDRKGLRSSAGPFWDTAPRPVPDGTPFRTFSRGSAHSQRPSRHVIARRRRLDGHRVGAPPNRRARSRRTRCGRGAALSREWRAECQRYPEMARGAVVSTRRWSAWPSPADASTACGSPGLIGRWARNHSTYSSALTARVALRRSRRRGRGPILAFLW